MLDINDFAFACQMKNRAELERHCELAGLDLSLQQVDTLTAALKGNTRIHDVLNAALDALRDESGIGLVEVPPNSVRHHRGKHFVLAVRDGNRIAIAHRHARNLPLTVGDVWPDLRPWFRDLRRNRPRIDAWLPKAESELAGHIGVRPKAAGSSDTNEASLTAAIQQAPDDDNLRLVLADHLLERSDVRGELIRLGVELKTLEPREEELPRKQFDQLMGLRRDLEQLVASHGKRLAGDIARHATDFTFDRGFVGAVTMSASAFGAHGDRLFAQNPIHTLQLRPINDALVKKLAGCSGLARVRHLRLGNPGVREAKPVKYAGLVTSRHLGALESLDLTYAATLPADWEETFAGLVAPKLKSIAFDWSVVSPRIFTGLARNKQPMPLQRLSFCFAGSAKAFNYVFPGKRVPKGATDAPAAFIQGLSLLGTAPIFNALSVLSLEGWPVPEPALLAWLDGPNVKSIEQLDLRNTGCGPTFVAKLARMKGLKLKSLKIGVEDSKGIAALLHSDAGARLEAFDWTSPDESKTAIEQVVDAALALPKKHPLKKLGFDAEQVLSDKRLAEVRRRFAT